jgi:hypothetical protein
MTHLLRIFKTGAGKKTHIFVENLAALPTPKKTRHLEITALKNHVGYREHRSSLFQERISGGTSKNQHSTPKGQI